jgi:hypothetical protein
MPTIGAGPPSAPVSVRSSGSPRPARRELLGRAELVRLPPTAGHRSCRALIADSGGRVRRCTRRARYAARLGDGRLVELCDGHVVWDEEPFGARPHPAGRP